MFFCRLRPVKNRGRNKDPDAFDCGTGALITPCLMGNGILERPIAAMGLKKIFITDPCRTASGEKALPA